MGQVSTFTELTFVELLGYPFGGRIDQCMMQGIEDVLTIMKVLLAAVHFL